MVGLPYPEALYAMLGSQGHVKLVNSGRVRDDTPLTQEETVQDRAMRPAARAPHARTSEHKISGCKALFICFLHAFAARVLCRVVCRYLRRGDLRFFVGTISDLRFGLLTASWPNSLELESTGTLCIQENYFTSSSTARAHTASLDGARTRAARSPSPTA